MLHATFPGLIVVTSCATNKQKQRESHNKVYAVDVCVLSGGPCMCLILYPGMYT